MRFFVDRCAGRRLAEWLRTEGHDVIEASSLGVDPGDAALLQLAEQENRVLVTIDTDFGTLVFGASATHRGLVRLPDVPAVQRIEMMSVTALGINPGSGDFGDLGPIEGRWRHVGARCNARARCYTHDP